MNVNYIKKDKVLELELTEEIDHHNAMKVRNRADYEIQKFMPKTVIIDLKNVGFMDSAGIGLVLGRYKLSNMIGADLKIRNINRKIKKVFEMSGILKIIETIEDENQTINGGKKANECV